MSELDLKPDTDAREAVFLAVEAASTCWRGIFPRDGMEFDTNRANAVAHELISHLAALERDAHPLLSVRAAHGPAFGTVDRDYHTGEAPVTITMPSGHVLTLDAEQPPIYAAEHLHTGQRVAWATWLAGNAVVGAE